MIILFSLLPIALFSIYILVVKTSNSSKKPRTIDDLGWEDKQEYKKLNIPIKCKCGITSRRYQFKGEENLICPQCEYDYKYVYKLPCDMYRIPKKNIDRDYPFAPKLSINKFLEDKELKNEQERIKEELRILKSNDNEIEAWENIQLSKLEKLQQEAERIKQEIKDNDKLKSTSNFDFIEKLNNK